jgi:pilus assembly protein CpaB
VRRRWLIVAAVGLGAFALHFAYVRALGAEARGGEAVAVLVTTERVGRGALIAEAALATREIPAAYVGGRAVPAARAAEVIGLPATVDVEAQEVLQWTDVAARAGDAEQRDLARLVGSGERAMTIPVDAALAMGGLLKPGHRVDILGTFARDRSLKADRVTVTLLQNVTVLATGDSVAGAEDGAAGAAPARYATVTLSVGLEEAELLSYASREGRLSLVLRGYQDLRVVSDVPEKGIDDVWEADRRNALQGAARGGNGKPIERLKAR